MPIDAPAPKHAHVSDVARKARAARLLLEELPGAQAEASALLHEAWRLLASVVDAEAPTHVGNAAAETLQTGDLEPSKGGPSGAIAKASSEGSAATPANEPGLEPAGSSSRTTSLLSEAPAAVRAFLEDASAAPSVAVLLDGTSFVERAARRHARSGRSPIRRFSRVVSRKQIKIAAAAGLSALALWAAVKIFDASGPKVWLARFYPELEFRGKPVRTAFSSLQHDWGRGSSVPDFPKQGYSARFDTCLRLANDADVQFWIQSKEGSALSIDGRRELSNWNVAKSPVAKERTVHLKKGVHHLSVDYFNQVGQAAIRLRAAIDGGSLKPLDHHQLESPIAWPDQVEVAENGARRNARDIAARVCAQ